MTDEEYDAYLEEIVDEAPPLTNDQRARIAALLRTPPAVAELAAA